MSFSGAAPFVGQGGLETDKAGRSLRAHSTRIPEPGGVSMADSSPTHPAPFKGGETQSPRVQATTAQMTCCRHEQTRPQSCGLGLRILDLPKSLSRCVSRSPHLRHHVFTPWGVSAGAGGTPRLGGLQFCRGKSSVLSGLSLLPDIRGPGSCLTEPQ